MDEWNGVSYDPEQTVDLETFGFDIDETRLDRTVTRFMSISCNMPETARLLAEAKNPGFKAVAARVDGFDFRVELWKERRR